MKKRFLQFGMTAKAVMIALLIGLIGVIDGNAQSFTENNLRFYVNADGVSVTVFGHINGQSATGTLSIPETVLFDDRTYYVTTIADYAFKDCVGFTGSLNLPNSVNTIGESAFYGCTGFRNDLTLPNSLTEIGNSAFRGCIGFTGNLVFPDALITIGNWAFYDCYFFTGNLYFGNSVTTIGDGAFGYCSGFTGELILPNSVITIGNFAFSECSGFTGDLIIPNSVNTIGNNAFSGCSGLTGYLNILNTNIEIGNSAFAWCSDLIEGRLFGTTPPSLGSNVFSSTSFPIYVPYESLITYKNAENWNNYENRIYPMSYKSIPGYSQGNSSWRFIASPLAENTAPTEINDMLPTTGTYDLYRFDQTENAEWRNYKANNFNLVNGQGYLYANAEDVNLIFKGMFNEDETKNVELVYDANASFAGWNLVGNPFPVSAYANKSFYTMNEDGTAIEPVAVSNATAVPVCTGIMVKAESVGESVVFSKTAPETQGQNNGTLQIVLSQLNPEPVEGSKGGVSTGSTTALDKAIVSFNAVDRLEKFVFNKDNATLSIPQGGKDLAIANAEKEGELPLNFKAAKNGEYTITVNPEAVEMDYLHLIDNMTGNDIDLLASPSYSFNAETTDYASRFRLVFSASGDADGDNEDFAFVSNNDIIINGEGTVQVIDMTGRIIVSVDEGTRCIPTAGMTSGVYVLRLINGNDVKTQKIVVR